MAAAALGLALVAGVMAWGVGRGGRATAEVPLNGGFDVEQARRDAQQHFHYGQYKEAEGLLAEVVRRRPADADARKLLAEVYLAQRRVGEAYEQARAGLDLEPGDAEAQFMAGVIASKIGRLDASRVHHAKAAELGPGVGRYAAFLGTVLLELGRVDEAEAEGLRAKAVEPSLPEAYLLLAGVAERRGDHERAAELIGDGLELMASDDPRRVSYVLFKARQLRRMGKPRDALSLLHATRAGEGEIVRVSEEMAECYLAVEDVRKAAAVWVELFALQPRNGRAAAEAGLCLLRAGDARQAVRYLGLARAADPSHEKVRALESAIEESARARS